MHPRASPSPSPGVTPDIEAIPPHHAGFEESSDGPAISLLPVASVVTTAASRQSCDCAFLIVAPTGRQRWESRPGPLRYRVQARAKYLDGAAVRGEEPVVELRSIDGPELGSDGPGGRRAREQRESLLRIIGASQDPSAPEISTTSAGPSNIR